VCTKLIAFDKSSKMLASEPQGFKQNSSEFNTEAKPESAPSVPGETVNQEVSIHTLNSSRGKRYNSSSIQAHKYARR
jgi:subtilase family serine protease